MYISEVLYQHGEYITDLVTDAIESKGLISDKDKDHLIDSISTKVYNMKGINPMLVLNFPSYGRFIEIKYHKNSRNTDILQRISTNKSIIQGVGTNRKMMKKKDTRWYSKNVYGSLNRLIGMLMYEFSDQERERLTRILETKQTT